MIDEVIQAANELAIEYSVPIYDEVREARSSG